MSDITRHVGSSLATTDPAERVNMPEVLTRIRFRGSDAVIAQDAMICPFGVFPFYRERGAFGMDDGGDAA